MSIIDIIRDDIMDAYPGNWEQPVEYNLHCSKRIKHAIWEAFKSTGFPIQAEVTNGVEIEVKEDSIVSYYLPLIGYLHIKVDRETGYEIKKI